MSGDRTPAVPRWQNRRARSARAVQPRASVPTSRSRRPWSLP